MAHTFTQIYIQAVFAVALRQSLIRPEFKEELPEIHHWHSPEKRTKAARDKLDAGSHSYVDRHEAKYCAL